MAEAQEYLDRWGDAGLIDAPLKQRILMFEAVRRQRPVVSAPRPGVVEVLLYLGVAIAIAGILGLAEQHWAALGSAARLATFSMPGVLSLVAGLIMRRTGQAQFIRACGIAWLVAVALLGGAVAVAAHALGWSGSITALVAALAAIALAIGLYAANPSSAQQLALAGSILVVSESIAGQVSPYRPELAGLLLLVFGAMGILLAERRTLRPEHVAAALGALLLLGGALHIQAALTGIWAGVPELAAGAILVASSLRWGRFSYLLSGVLAIFLGLVWFIFEHFERTIGVPAALLLTGCLLVGGVLFVTAWHRRRQTHRNQAAASAADAMQPMPADVPQAVDPVGRGRS